MNIRCRRVAVLSCLGAAGAFSCWQTGDVGSYQGAVPAFASPETSAVSNDEGGMPFVAYCPSNKCPAGLTTCPTSYFPCDVDLRTDPFNCGTCGARCPPNTHGETFECIDGECVMSCNHTFGLRFDCDGVPDNGCETVAVTNDNCGGCGIKCLEPEKPCIYLGANTYACGCPPGHVYCAQPQPRCIVPSSDDANCGGCGIKCDPDLDGGARPPNTYFGCQGGTCGQLKCQEGYAECDGNPVNGCESLTSNENCGACGNACPAGTRCAVDSDGKPFCACPQGQTFCGDCWKQCDGGSCSEERCVGSCHDLTSDVFACGGCGISCVEGVDGTDAVPFLAACVYGTCTRRCPLGRADCNGNTADGCEVNTMADPANCGGCGVVCNAIAGQACVRGRCVVEPCEPVHDDGGVAR
jgi:hypothetical protein